MSQHIIGGLALLRGVSPEVTLHEVAIHLLDPDAEPARRGERDGAPLDHSVANDRMQIIDKSVSDKQVSLWQIRRGVRGVPANTVFRLSPPLQTVCQAWSYNYDERGNVRSGVPSAPSWVHRAGNLIVWAVTTKRRGNLRIDTGANVS